MTFTIEQVLALIAAMPKQTTETTGETFTAHIGKKCIVRTYASGVFFGVVTKQSVRAVEIAECRRLWQWKAANGISLSSVAINGVDASGCRITAPVVTQTVLDALEIIPTTLTATTSIEALSVSQAS
jgi:hypothetical protein